MCKWDRGLFPGTNRRATSALCAGAFAQIDIDVYAVLNKDSSNMSPNDWVVIANAIQEKYSEYDGIVVLHGTDTMAYSAAG